MQKAEAMSIVLLLVFAAAAYFNLGDRSDIDDVEDEEEDERR